MDSSPCYAYTQTCYIPNCIPATIGVGCWTSIGLSESLHRGDLRLCLGLWSFGKDTATLAEAGEITDQHYAEIRVFCHLECMNRTASASGIFKVQDSILERAGKSVVPSICWRSLVCS